MAYDEVNEDNVYTCVGHPLRREIENIINWMLNEDFTKAYNSILFMTEYTGETIKLYKYLNTGSLHYITRPIFSCFKITCIQF